MAWSCLAPSPQRLAVPGDSEIGDSVSLLIRLFLTDVSELNYNGKGIWSEALSVMPWIKETAECWLQVKTACLSSHLHIPMHWNSPHDKLSSQQAKPVSCPWHHPKILTGLCLWDLQHALRVRRFKFFGERCKSISQSCSPCLGVERGDLSQALPAAGASQSSWIIKHWSFLPCLCIPNICW